MNERSEKEALYEEEEINLLDILIVLCKRKRLIIGITLSLAIITALISLLMPNIYRAKTTLLPPKGNTQGTASQVLSQLGEAAGIAGSMLGISSPADLYVGMLKSRTVFDRIIERFDLIKFYKTKTLDEARSILSKNVKIKVDKKSEIITIAVEDKDPERAAQMANAFIEELRNLTKRLALTEAAQRRLFFEEQLKNAKEALTKAEKDMAEFQTKTGAIKIDEQAKAVIEAIANLKARIAEKEVELKVMKTYSTPNNPDLQKLEEALKGLRAELKKLEASQKSKGYDPLMPANLMPEVGTEYLRKLRELKFAETLYELLLKQYEIAKMDEARNAVIIQVIDKAVPPEKKVKPNRILMIIIALITGVFFSIFLAFIIEYFESISEDPKNSIRIEKLKRYVPFI